MKIFVSYIRLCQRPNCARSAPRAPFPFVPAGKATTPPSPWGKGIQRPEHFRGRTSPRRRTTPPLAPPPRGGGFRRRLFAEKFQGIPLQNGFTPQWISFPRFRGGSPGAKRRGWGCLGSACGVALGRSAIRFGNGRRATPTPILVRASPSEEGEEQRRGRAPLSQGNPLQRGKDVCCGPNCCKRAVPAILLQQAVRPLQAGPGQENRSTLCLSGAISGNEQGTSGQ